MFSALGGNISSFHVQKKVIFVILTVCCVFSGFEGLHASSRRSHLRRCAQEPQKRGVRFGVRLTTTKPKSLGFAEGCIGFSSV